MVIRSLNGDNQMNEFAMLAMAAVVETMVREGQISAIDGDKFIEEHISLIVHQNGPFKEVYKRIFPTSTGTDHYTVICAKTK